MLHFTDAQKLTRPTAFTTMIKPVGSACNLDCDYCYYLGKAALYEGRQPKMSDELLERYISQYIEAVQVPVVTFCWHGGEPLLAGIDFYEKAVALQNKYRGNKQIENSLQTNGLLINGEWCDFFRRNNFLIGLSLDGPKEIHDAYRRDRGGHPTFDRVMKALEMMAVSGVEYNTLSTINDRCAGQGKRVYDFMRSVSRYMQFLPVVEMVEGSDPKVESLRLSVESSHPDSSSTLNPQPSSAAPSFPPAPLELLSPPGASRLRPSGDSCVTCLTSGSLVTSASDSYSYSTSPWHSGMACSPHYAPSAPPVAMAWW